MIKKLFLVLLVLALVPSLASAATLQTNSHYFLPLGQTVNGNLYVASGNTTVAGNVNGDLYLGAGTATITGEVRGDLVVAGGTVTVTGVVDGDLRVLGGNVTVAGPVRGDVFVIGGSLSLSDAVGGDADFIGGMLSVESGATVTGRLVYRSNSEARISNQAVIRGGVTYDQTLAKSIGIVKEAGAKSVVSGFAALLGVWIFLKLLMYLFAALVFYWLFRPYLEGIVHQAVKMPGRALGVGFITLVVVPALALVFAISIVGLPLAIILGLAYLIILGVAKLSAGALIGAWGEKIILKRANYRVGWQGVIGGTLVLFILMFIPVIGWIIAALACLLTFGAIADVVYKKWLAR